MALAAYIAVAVVVIIAIVVFKLLRSTSKTSALSFSSRCPKCGRQKGILKCQFCHPGTDSRQRW